MSTENENADNVEEGSHVFAVSSLPERADSIKIDGQLATTTGCTWSTRKKTSIALLAAVLALAAVAIGLAVGLSSRSSARGGSNDAAAAADSSSSTTSAPLSRYENIVAYVSGALEVQAGDEDAPSLFPTAGSPQSQAARWMSDEDAMQLPVPTNVGGNYESAEARAFLQRYALTTLFFATGGPTWKIQHNFLSENDDSCDWKTSIMPIQIHLGVICGKDDSVRALIMPRNNMTGSLPPEIGLLTDLVLISMEENSIGGALPSSMRHLNQMEAMLLQYNDLTGDFPQWIGALTELSILKLSNNNLGGGFPPAASMSKLTKLRELFVDDNDMTGSLSGLYDTTSLTHLLLEDNNFVADIAAEEAADDQTFFFRKLKTLGVLDVSNNLDIKGPFPSHLLDSDVHPNLKVLDLHSNKISGNLHSSVPKNTILDVLSLYDNAIGGSLKYSVLENLVGLTHLDVSNNAFTGNMPDGSTWSEGVDGGDGGMADHLTYLFLANNSFVPGPIPDFSSFTQLRELSLKGTSRTGPIPSNLGSLESLVLLDLDGNDLTSTIPPEIGQLTELKFLLLNRNRLDGPIPKELSNIASSLVMVLLEKNDITGTTEGSICPDNVGDSALQVAIADCGVACPCCTECCSDDDEQCNDGGLLANYDPVWELNYDRRAYDFENDEDIVSDALRFNGR